jgi:hypothetical protein
LSHLWSWHHWKMVSHQRRPAKWSIIVYRS